jgi:hypothetical protein
LDQLYENEFNHKHIHHRPNFPSHFTTRLDKDEINFIRYKNDEIRKRDKTIDNLNNEHDSDGLKIERLIEENEKLRKQNEHLKEDNERLKNELELKEVQINRNSSNSN